MASIKYSITDDDGNTVSPTSPVIEELAAIASVIDDRIRSRSPEIQSWWDFDGYQTISARIHELQHAELKRQA
ncbi:MAG TPA: hypothetical protein VIQ30_24305 [Pseudonocardia sp.]